MLAKELGNLHQKRARLGRQQRLGLLCQSQRPLLEKKGRAVGQLVEITGSSLEDRHRFREQRDVRAGADPFGRKPRQTSIVGGADVMAIEVLQLLDVEARRALADAAEVE